MPSGDLGSFRRWACPILLAGVTWGFDGANRMIHYGPLSAAPLDEVAHLATAALGLLVLARFIDVPVRFYIAALVASVAIDLDHIPGYLGLLGDQNGRPFTHSLATVAVFAGAAMASRRHRAVLAGAAVGLLLHFARDIVEGPPGVRMLWPLQQTAWTGNYWWFLGMITLFASARLVLVSLGTPHSRWRACRSEPDPG
jgi:inner membrane protein